MATAWEIMEFLCFISVQKNACFAQLITWRDVFDGYSEDIQVWDRQNSFQNLVEAFRNRKSTEEGIMIIMSTCYK